MTSRSSSSRARLSAEHSALRRSSTARTSSRAPRSSSCSSRADNALHLGCLGHLTAELVFLGESAHSARPWLGRNAIREAVEGLPDLVALEPVDVDVQGSVPRGRERDADRGRDRDERDPGRGADDAELSLRADRAPEDAETRFRELVASTGAEVDADGELRGRTVALDSPLVRRLQASGDFALEPKQAWTPVAEFTRAAGSTPSTSVEARRATRTGATSRSRSPRWSARTAPSALPRRRRFVTAVTSLAASRRWASVSAWPSPPRRPDRHVSLRPAGRRRVEAAGVEVIDFGMGDPASGPSSHRARARRRPPARGRAPRAHGLQSCARRSRWAERRFSVALDPATEIVPTLGSKEAIFGLAQLVVDRDGAKSVVAFTERVPGLRARCARAGGEPQPLPLLERNAFLPDLEAVDWERTALLWLNYPNNPTGAVASLAFLERAAELATATMSSSPATRRTRRSGSTRLRRPRFQLAVANVLVFNTLSKRSNMTGYRSGFAAGDPALVAAMKSFRPSVGTAPRSSCSGRRSSPGKTRSTSSGCGPLP